MLVFLVKGQQRQCLNAANERYVGLFINALRDF
jgi:hypothetical protein